MIRLKGEDADQLYNELKKQKTFQKEDVIRVLLSPLMSGDMSVKDRIINGLKFIQHMGKEIAEEEKVRMQSILYALAVKLLQPEELVEVKEELFMTILGKMLMEEGISRGISQGISQGLSQGLVQGTVRMCRKMGFSMDHTCKEVMEQCTVSEEEAAVLVEKYWDSKKADT